MNPPKHVQAIMQHYEKCYRVESCLRCPDLISFGLLYLEDNNIQIHLRKPLQVILEPSKMTVFRKFLQVAIGEYMRKFCPRTISGAAVAKFSKWLLKLSKEEKGEFRVSLMIHEEFNHEDYSDEVSKLPKRVDCHEY